MSYSLHPRRLCSPWNSPGQNTGMGSFSLLQGNLPNPGIEPRSPALQVDSLPAKSQGKPEKYWNGLPIPFPVDLPDPGLELESLALQADSLLTELSGKPGCIKVVHYIFGDVINK